MGRTLMRSLLTRLLIPLLLCGLTACVYRVDVQQGNLLDQTDIDAVRIGMTRSQVIRHLVDTASVRPAIIRTEVLEVVQPTVRNGA